MSYAYGLFGRLIKWETFHLSLQFHNGEHRPNLARLPKNLYSKLPVVLSMSCHCQLQPTIRVFKLKQQLIRHLQRIINIIK